MKRKVLIAALMLFISPIQKTEASHVNFPAIHSKETHSISYGDSNRTNLVSFSDPVEHVFETSSISLKFQVLRNEELTILKTENGLSSSYTIENDTITFQIEIQDIGYSSLSIHFSSFDSSEQDFQLHFYKENEAVYFSYVSKEEVLQMAGNEMGKIGIYTQSLAVASQANSNGTILNLKWKDRIGNSYPLAGIEIHYTESANAIEHTAYSDKDGIIIIPKSHYEIDSMITIFSKTKTAIITDRENFSSKPTLSYKDCYSYDLSLSSDYTDVTIDMSSTFGKVLQISQAIYYYAEYYKDLIQQSDIEEINVCYPSEETNCFYSSGLNLMRVSGTTFGNELESYESWDIIGHEYGHYIENKIGFAKRNNNKAFDHNSANNDIDSHGKLDGTQLAFSESWPTYFAISAQQYFPSFIKSKVKSVGNDIYEAFNFSSSDYYSLSKIYDSQYSGDGCERTLMNIFYHLYDEGINEYDKFSLGDKYLWNIIVKHKPNTLNDFLSSLYNEGINRDDLGLLLERTHVCATNITISNSPSISAPPKITWTSPTWRPYNDSYFELVFYTNDGTFLFNEGTKQRMYATYYTPTASEWELILKSSGTEYYVIVKTYQYQNGVGLITGPYYSNTRSFRKPMLHETKNPLSLSSNFKYYEDKVNLNPGNTLTYQFYFPYSCKYIIQTFGMDETQISISKNDKVIASDNSEKGYSGNAFLHTYLEKNTLYSITIQAYDEDEPIDTKLVIIPCDADIKDKDSFSCFDDISTTYDNSSSVKTISANLHRYSSTVFVFEPMYVATYNIYIDSDADNYLYVLNPEHTEALQEGTDYNDDFSDDEYDPDYNASVTKAMTLGTKYLIILSQSNPTSSYSESERICKITITRRNP